MATSMTTPNGQLPEPAQQTAAQQAVPQPQQISPQAANAIHDSMIGKAFKVLSGQNTQYSVNPQTGQMQTTQVQNTPGQLFKNIVAAALVGGAAGADSARQNAGSPLAAAAKGGVAVMNRNQQLDQERVQRAQQDYQNQLRANEEQRNQQTFQNDQVLFNAQMATNKIKTLGLIQQLQGQSFDLHKEAADMGRAVLSPYYKAGVKPYAENVPESDMPKWYAEHPGASTQYDIHATGMAPFTDADGKTTYQNTYTIFSKADDPTKKMYPVTQSLYDQLKKYHVADMDDPEAGTVKVGQQLNAVQHAALANALTTAMTRQIKLNTQNLTEQEIKAKTQASLATAAHQWVEASKAKQEIAASALGKKKQDQINAVMQNLAKANGDTSKLSSADKLVLAESSPKMVKNYLDEYKIAKDQDAPQSTLDSITHSIDLWRQLGDSAIQAPQSEGSTVQMTNPQGQLVAVPKNKLQEALAHGYKQAGVSPKPKDMTEPLTPENVPEGLVILKGPQGQMEARPAEGIGSLKKDPKYKGYQIVGYGKQQNATSISAPPPIIQYNPNS